MLAETMAEVKAGRMDPKVANTVAYVATVLLRAYETDSAPTADTPAQPYVPLIYRRRLSTNLTSRNCRSAAQAGDAPDFLRSLCLHCLCSTAMNTAFVAWAY